MNAISRKFVFWLMSLSTLMRYFVVAVLVHVLVLFVLGSIKLVSEITAVKAVFRGDPLPPSIGEMTDPTDVLRGDPDYHGPQLNGKGTPGPGMGGTPNAGGPAMPDNHVSTPNSSTAADRAVSEVMAVVSETAATRIGPSLGGDAIGLPGPASSMGDGKLGIPGLKGTGGGNPFGQRGPAMRLGAIKNGGGSDAGEKSVLAALRWLKEHQESDGSWSPQAFTAGKTGLATLCFLGHGETPDSEEFGSTVSKALSYLASTVGDDGIIKSRSMYDQGIVALALAEGYGMTQSPIAKEPLERAINAILLSQKVKKTSSIHVGGWRYTPISTDSDTSVAGWNIMGLKSAKLAGLKIPDDSLDAASKYIWNMYGDGGFGYAGPGVGNATTAVGILCEQFLGHADDKRLKKALDYYMKQKVNWEKPANTLYGWYYATQAMFQAGGNHWTYWNHEIRDTLVKNQANDGHWTDPGPATATTEPVLSTTLCCLMLEVYYRYLPIYHEVEHNTTPASLGERASLR